MMKSQNKSRLKALGIDIAVIFCAWGAIVMLSVLLIRLHGEELPPFFRYFFHYHIPLGIAIALFLCKDLIGGQSIGKRICHLRVIEEDGSTPVPLKLYLRNIFFVIGFIEIIFLFAANRRMGDIALQTRVVPASGKNPHATLKQKSEHIIFFLISILLYCCLSYTYLKI